MGCATSNEQPARQGGDRPFQVPHHQSGLPGVRRRRTRKLQTSDASSPVTPTTTAQQGSDVSPQPSTNTDSGDQLINPLQPPVTGRVASEAGASSRNGASRSLHTISAEAGVFVARPMSSRGGSRVQSNASERSPSNAGLKDSVFGTSLDGSARSDGGGHCDNSVVVVASSPGSLKNPVFGPPSSAAKQQHRRTVVASGSTSQGLTM